MEDKDIKGIAKVISKFVEIVTFTKENWYLLVLFGGMIWGIAKMYYYNFVEPEVNHYVTTVVIQSDTLPVIIKSQVDSILEKRGVSFRSELVSKMNVNKDQVADSIGYMYVSFKNYKNKVDEFDKYVFYTNGIIKLLVQESFKLYVDPKGVKIYDAPSGDTYYFDSFGFLWGATWSNADNCYYYFPPYNNNERTKCL